LDIWQHANPSGGKDPECARTGEKTGDWQALLRVDFGIFQNVGNGLIPPARDLSLDQSLKFGGEFDAPASTSSGIAFLQLFLQIDFPVGAFLCHPR
jgi:hypothetical protein